MKLRDRNHISKFIKDTEIIDNSTPSYSLRTSKGKDGAKAALIEKFLKTSDTETIEAFDQAFDQASAGQGYEVNNLLTLHSSALLALLCFFNLKGKTLIFPENVNLTSLSVSEVFFEVENIVLEKNDRNSSIDIALWDEGSKTLLLLESKFIEPTNGGNIGTISVKYEEYLSDLEEYKINISSSGKSINVESKAKPGKGEKLPYYCGIKQMIAHLMGAMTGPAPYDDPKIRKRRKKYQQRYQEVFSQATSIYLGTILMDSEKIFEANEIEMIRAYQDLYRRSINKLKAKIKQTEDKEIHLISEPLSYGALFSRSRTLLPTVKNFYCF